MNEDEITASTILNQLYKMSHNQESIPTIKDYKIWFPFEIFYIESMLTITRTAMAEVACINEIIDNQVSKGDSSNKESIIDFVQNIITSAGSLSRYFWPSNKNEIHKLRGQRLRAAFDINESNILRNRDVRNFIEHFDEKLDLYLSSGIAGTILPSYVGSRITENESIVHFFRAYFWDEKVFRILNVEYQIQPIMIEIYRVNCLLEKYKNEGGRLPL